MTDLERYCTGILDGKIVACRRMKQVAERLLEDLASPGEFHFDPDIAAGRVEGGILIIYVSVQRFSFFREAVKLIKGIFPALPL